MHYSEIEKQEIKAIRDKIIDIEKIETLISNTIDNHNIEDEKLNINLEYIKSLKIKEYEKISAIELKIHNNYINRDYNPISNAVLFNDLNLSLCINKNQNGKVSIAYFDNNKNTWVKVFKINKLKTQLEKMITLIEKYSNIEFNKVKK